MKRLSSVIARTTLVAVAAASAAQAQSMTTTTSQARPASAPSVASSGPESLYGLRPSATKKVLRFADALKLASEQSWDLRIVRERVEQQDALLQRAWSNVLPQVSATASYTYNLPKQEVSFSTQDQVDQQALLFRSIGGIVAGAAAQNPDPQQAAEQQAQAQALLAAADTIEEKGVTSIEITPENVGNAGLNIVIPLFSGGAIPQIMNATAGLDVAKKTLAQSRASVVLGVARAYYGAFTAQRFVAIAQEQLAATSAHRDLTKTQSDDGLITPLALQRAELDVVRAEQSLRSATQTAAQTRATLGLLLGVVDDFDIEAPPPVPAIEQQENVAALVERARNERPDLAAERLAVEIAERGETAAWLQFLPSLSLQAQGRATTFTGGLTAEPLTAAVTLQASIPIYDGGARWSSTRESASRLTEERARLEQLEAKIESQVRGNADDIRVRGDALTTAQRALALAKAAQESAVRFYELGTATNLDVIDANLGVFAAELDEARAELDVAQGRLGLAFILGELRPE